MPKPPKTVFVCQECGSQAPKWLGRCPDCAAWNSFVEERPQDPGDEAVTSSRNALTGGVARLYGEWVVALVDLDPARAAEDFATYAAEVEAARAVLAAKDYDDTFTYRHSRGEDTIDVRALALHMIEEYARHNGHADLLRQAVDGRTGE